MIERLCAWVGTALVLGGMAVLPCQADEGLAKKNGCAACHAPEKKIVGPSWHDVAAKYKGDAGALDKLAAKVKAGSKGTWGTVPMPPQAKVSDTELKAILTWAMAQ